MAVSEAVLALSAVFFAVTPDDVDAAYRHNAHQPTTIRVDWVRTQRTSADLLQRLKQESLEYRKWLDSGEVLPEMRATVEQMAAPGIDSAFKQPLPLSAVLDYWSDRESFQLRILNDDGQPNYYSTDPPLRIIHPDVESLVGDFPKALSQYMVITGRGSGQPFRVWLGSKQAPQYSYHRALVSFKPPIAK